MTLSSSTFSPHRSCLVFCRNENALLRWNVNVEKEIHKLVLDVTSISPSSVGKMRRVSLLIFHSKSLCIEWAKRALKYQQIYHYVRYVTNRWCKISHIRQFEYLMWLYKMWSMVMEDRWNCESKWNRKWMSVISSFT